MTIGHHRWVISAGRIPLRSTGLEPAFTSRDQVSLLNAGDLRSEVSIMLFYSDRGPIGPYKLSVAPRRMRCVRVNDLIEPQAPPLDDAYGAVVDATSPIVVQFTRQDTSVRNGAGLMTMAFAVK